MSGRRGGITSEEERAEYNETRNSHEFTFNDAIFLFVADMRRRPSGYKEAKRTGTAQRSRSYGHGTKKPKVWAQDKEAEGTGTAQRSRT
ncbi:hypothetical protein AVEN_104556-1 [Araneus ventricosus]|uniref:Uncharacterized protein n=1 Tax=Araneus ventricosus TaxID=182803 RepID=A0A4Y2W255_ARAVE|nr:hypothetical protein AVEN_104556-1 [Araneus ventricosus]